MDPTQLQQSTSWSLEDEDRRLAILGRLDPPQWWYDYPAPSAILNHYGLPMLDQLSKPVRDYEFLPLQIPRNLNPIDDEIYHRLDATLSYSDISARMLGPALDSRQRNVLRNERLRKARIPCHARRWTRNYPKQPHRDLVEHVESLTWEQIERNTTWTLSPQGIKNPLTGRYLPSDYFQDNGIEHDPSREVMAAIKESQRLRSLAAQYGVNHWRDLSVDLLPREWFVRAKSSDGHDSRAPGLGMIEASRGDEYIGDLGNNEAGTYATGNPLKRKHCQEDDDGFEVRNRRIRGYETHNYLWEFEDPPQATNFLNDWFTGTDLDGQQFGNLEDHPEEQVQVSNPRMQAEDVKIIIGEDDPLNLLLQGYPNNLPAVYRDSRR